MIRCKTCDTPDYQPLWRPYIPPVPASQVPPGKPVPKDLGLFFKYWKCSVCGQAHDAAGRVWDQAKVDAFLAGE